MFEHKVAAQVEESDAGKEFLSLYERVFNGRRDIQDQINSGKVVRERIIQLRKLEVAMDNAWTRLPEDLRKAVVESLIQRQMVPDTIRKIISVFDARVIRVN